MKPFSLACVSLLLATTAMAQPAASPGSSIPDAGVPGAPGSRAGTGGSPPIAATMPDAGMAPGAAPGTTAPNSKPGVAPRTNAANHDTGPSAASGDHNEAVATTSAHASQPAHGANSYTAGQARRRLESHGFQNVSDLKKDKDGVWRGKGTKSGQQVGVWLDYRGNAGQQ